MKNTLFASLLIAGFCFAQVLTLDLSKPDSRLTLLNASYAGPAVEDGTPCMRVDTRASQSEWNPAFALASGVLKPGKSYVLRFSAKLAEASPDSFLHVLVRPLDASGGREDMGTVNVDAVGKIQKCRLRFAIPEGREGYSVQFHTRRKVLALIDAISIEEGDGLRYFPHDQNVRSAAPAPAKPTGCPAFDIEGPRATRGPVLSVADFGANPSLEDNMPAFLAAIAAARERGASRLEVPKGIYHFTNNAPLHFEGLSDFTFDGKGSEFIWLKTKNTLIEIDRCERARFQGFFVDWDWAVDPLGSVVEVKAVEPSGKHLDVFMPDVAAFPRTNMRIATFEGIDPRTGSVGYDGSWDTSFEFFKGRNKPARYEWQGPNAFRLFADGRESSFAAAKPGQRFRIRHYVYDMAGIRMSANTNLTLTNITIYSTPSHGFVSEGEQHHWQLLDTHIRPRPGAKRPVTTTADHHHVAQSLGYMKMIGCDFGWGGDDCLNVHDTSGWAAKTGARTLVPRNMSTTKFRPGDPIELRHDDYSPTGVVVHFLSREGDGNASSKSILTFAEDLPDPKGEGFILFNRRYGSANILVKDCFFHDNKARGVLLLTDNVTVENCRFFHNQGGAIKLETGYTFNVWSEGYGVSNVLLRGNRFERANAKGYYPGEMYPEIYMSVYLKSDPSTQKTEYPILRDIRIEGNEFLNPTGVIAWVSCATNVVFEGNTVRITEPRQFNPPWRGSVGAAYAGGIRMVSNTWVRSPHMAAPGLYGDADHIGPVHMEGNRVVNP